MRAGNVRDWFEQASTEQLRGKYTEEGLLEYAHEICKYLYPAEKAKIDGFFL